MHVLRSTYNAESLYEARGGTVYKLVWSTNILKKCMLGLKGSRCCVFVAMIRNQVAVIKNEMGTSNSGYNKMIIFPYFRFISIYVMTL